MLTKKMSIEQGKDGVIILLDALGTKGIWKSKDPVTTLLNWEGIVATLEVDVAACKQHGVELKYNAFSDTLIITLTGDDMLRVLEEAGTTANSIINFGMAHGINFRGCLSIGKIHRSQSMILGEAIDEAAEYYGKSNWIGAFAAPSVKEVLDKTSKGDVWKSFLKYDVPLHLGVLQTWAVMLPNKIMGDNLKKNFLTEIIEEEILKHSGDIEMKWKNTMGFMQYILDMLSR